jgi:ribosome maturation factor RimP
MSEREVNRIREEIEGRLASVEPDVELLAVEQPANERLRLFIDRPAGVDLALCERFTNHLRDLLESYAL